VNGTLSFEPKYIVKDGIEESINAFKISFYNKFLANQNLYGNYEIEF
jgi:hypothetical protein